MTEEDGTSREARSTMVILRQKRCHPRTRRERTPISTTISLLLLNTSSGPVDFTLPDTKYGQIWHTVVDTAGDDDRAEYHSGDVVHVKPRTSLYPARARGL